MAALLWALLLVPAGCTLLAADLVGSERTTEWLVIVVSGVGLRMVCVVGVVLGLANGVNPRWTMEVLTTWATIAYLVVLVVETVLLIRGVTVATNSERVMR
ncbi:MAG: hypothetical protein LC104_05935 [Bacteroidales bacterium]|nr:hypothetical protein [Bacteroidales bacterium]